MDSKTKSNSLFILGLAICFGVATLSVLIEHLVPGGLLGASIIASFLSIERIWITIKKEQILISN